MTISDYPDFQPHVATAIAISGSDLTGTGLAVESGGNLAATASRVAQPGSTVAADVAASDLSGTGLAVESGGNLALTASRVAAPGKTVATELSGTSLTNTGLAKETGGNLATAASRIAGAGSTVAGDIAVTGAPLLRLYNSLAHGLAQALGVGQVVTLLGSTVIGQISLLVVINLEYTGADANPFVQLAIQWTDSTSGLNLIPDLIWLPVGNSARTSFIIEVPARGNEVAVALRNDGATQSLTYDYAISATSHILPAVRIIEVGNVSVSGFTRPGIASESGLLGAFSASVNAGATIKRLCSTWCGRASLSIDNPTASVFRVLLADPASLYGGVGSGALASYTQAANTSGTYDVTLPAGPVVMAVTNNGSGAATPTVALVRKETYA